MEKQKVQLASLNFCSSGNIAYLTTKIGNGEIYQSCIVFRVDRKPESVRLGEETAGLDIIC
jgi:hypothetical protein